MLNNAKGRERLSMPAPEKAPTQAPAKAPAASAPSSARNGGGGNDHARIIREFQMTDGRARPHADNFRASASAKKDKAS